MALKRMWVASYLLVPNSIVQTQTHGFSLLQVPIFLCPLFFLPKHGCKVAVLLYCSNHFFLGRPLFSLHTPSNCTLFASISPWSSADALFFVPIHYFFVRSSSPNTFRRTFPFYISVFAMFCCSDYRSIHFYLYSFVKNVQGICFLTKCL